MEALKNNCSPWLPDNQLSKLSTIKNLKRFLICMRMAIARTRINKKKLKNYKMVTF